MRIRQFRNEDFDAVLEIILSAFAPIHESFHSILGDDIFAIIYPDWKGAYIQYLSSLSQSDKKNILVMEDGETVTAFIVYSLDIEKEWGELGLNAVHPDFQNQGIGPKMYQHVLRRMRKQGMKMVEVSTGGDFSCASASSL